MHTWAYLWCSVDETRPSLETTIPEKPSLHANGIQVKESDATADSESDSKRAIPG